MLEARRAYRNAYLNDRVKTVTVRDPGANADLDDPRFNRHPPPPPPSPPGGGGGHGGGGGNGGDNAGAQAGTRADAGTRAVTGANAHAGNGSRPGGSGNANANTGNGGRSGGNGNGSNSGGSGYSTATPENPRPTGITLYPTRSAPCELQPTASTSTRIEPQSTSTSATRVASVLVPKTERSNSSRSQNQTHRNRNDASSPPTVGTVQNALDNLSVSSERRRHGTVNANSNEGYEYSRTSNHSSRRSTNYSRSIRSSPPTEITQVESGSGSTMMSSRHLSSLSSVASPDASPALGSSSSGSGKSKSSKSERKHKSSSRSLTEGTSKGTPFSSALARSARDGSTDSSGKAHSSRTSSSKHTSRSHVEADSTADRDRRHRRTYSSITTGTAGTPGSTKPSKSSHTSRSSHSSHAHRSHRSARTPSPAPSRSRTDDPDWSPKTDVTYYESGGSSPEPIDHRVSIDEREELEEFEDDGFATAPSSPELQPTTPPVMNLHENDGPAILHSMEGSSSSSLRGSMMEGWSSDRVHLISNPNYDESPKRVFPPRRTYSETGIQTQTETQSQTEANPDRSDTRGPVSICPTCHCHCHQSQPPSRSQSQSASTVGGDTVPATPVSQHNPLSPLNRQMEFAGALGLSTLSVPNISHSPGLDPRSPIARSTSLPAK
ncbi:hypothetical protein QCA50_011515 [Cerrena zonata]|uniref:Uncharacterized protein n=1 Tax=Cerrena zonata TaxID=2478898 RepID=A0AAW0G664_9APHY